MARYEMDGPGASAGAAAVEAALISKSLDGRITAWNAAAEKMFGYSAEEAIGKHISIVIPFDWQDQEYELLDRLKAEDYLEVHETIRRTKAGIFLRVKLSATPIRNGDGKIIGALKKIDLLETLGRMPPPPEVKPPLGAEPQGTADEER